MASMNRGLNLPGIQKIMNDFEKESEMMDMKEGMMSETIDEVMDEEEDEEEEGDKILKEVLDEIGVDLSHQVSTTNDLFLIILIYYFPLQVNRNTNWHIVLCCCNFEPDASCAR
jgi:hypothetical protein